MSAPNRSGKALAGDKRRSPSSHPAPLKAAFRLAVKAQTDKAKASGRLVAAERRLSDAHAVVNGLWVSYYGGAK